MVIFMGNSKPSQRFVFGLNFVKFTFLKGRKAKSNPGWAVSFSTCMEQAWMGTTGLLHLPSSASLSQQKLKASLWQTGLCCSLPFCSKLKDVPYLLPLFLSIISSPFSSWCSHHFQQPSSLCSIPWWLLSSHLILCNSRLILVFLCYNFGQLLLLLPSSLWSQLHEFWWSKADFPKKGVVLFHQLQWGR